MKKNCLGIRGEIQLYIIENLNSEIIEKKMGFKFSELELVGKCDSKNNNSATINVIYKDKKQLFIFSIRDNKIISINKITRDEQAKSMKSYFFTVNGKKYEYYLNEIYLIIARDKDNFYCYNGNNKQSWFTSDKLVKIANEEAVIIKMLNSFFEEENCNVN